MNNHIINDRFLNEMIENYQRSKKQIIDDILKLEKRDQYDILKEIIEKTLGGKLSCDVDLGYGGGDPPQMYLCKYCKLFSCPDESCGRNHFNIRECHICHEIVCSNCDDEYNSYIRYKGFRHCEEQLCPENFGIFQKVNNTVDFYRNNYNYKCCLNCWKKIKDEPHIEIFNN